MNYDVHIFAIVGIAIITDVVTGAAQALYHKILNSDKMRNGVYHKLSFIFAVCVAALIEYAMTYIDIGFTMPVVIPTCAYIIITELVSIVENVASMNPELTSSPVFNLLKNDKSDGD